MLPKQFRLSFDNSLKQSSVAATISRSEQGGRAGALVHPQIDSVILFLRERKTVLIQRLLEAVEVLRLVVGNDAVEVEDDGSNHTRPEDLTGFTLLNGPVRDKQLGLVRFSLLGYSPLQLNPFESCYD